MTLKRILDPAEQPVTFDQARKRSRILQSTAEAERDDIERAIRAGTERAEKTMGRAIIKQGWEKRLDAFPCNGGAIELAMPPVMSVDLVKYFDVDGIEQTLSPACYELDAQSETAWLVPAYGYVWPDTLEKINAVRVQFTAGWISPDIVPESIKDAIIAFAAFRYENRESAEMPPGFEDSLESYRVMRFA